MSSDLQKEYSLWGTRYFGLAFAQGYFDYPMKYGAKEMYITCVGDDKADYVILSSEFDKACIKMGEEFIRNSKKLLANYSKLKKKILASAKELSKKVGVVSDTELASLFDKYWGLVWQYQSYWMFPHYSERIVEPKLRKKYPKEFEVISSLSKPTQHMFMQKMLFEKSPGEVTKKFGWLSVISMAEAPFDKNYFLNYKKTLTKKQVIESFEQIKENKLRFKKVIKKLDKHDVKIANLLNKFVFLRTDRMDFWKEQCFVLYPFITYVAKKVSLEFGVREGSMLARNEMKDILLRKNIVSKEDLFKRGERKTVSIIFSDNNIKFYYDEVTKQKILSLYKSDFIEREIKGVVACKGFIKGKVKLYFSQNDVRDSDKGYILVCGHTTPQDLPIMKRALGIICDEGGVTSHAAIVARELNIPCIVGTKVATKILKDGDLVEVDANKGVVKIIKKF